jgi:hypothetical protein
MQLLSALDQIAEALWAAIYVAVVLFALGMIVHATILFVKRLRSGPSRWTGLREWARRVGEALSLF